MCKNVLTTSFAISLAMLLLIACSTAIAQQQKKALSNADVIAMVKVSLPENTIILAIQQGPTDFDTSALKLIELKNQGISPKILDAMIQAGTPVESQRQANIPSRTASNTNPLSPVSEINEAMSYGEVVMVDGVRRIEMTRSQVDSRIGGFMKQMVNPFGKTRVQGAINGNHSQLRTTNTSPMFEVGISSDLNASSYVALVKLKAKSDRREIEIHRGGITGISSGFRKEDIIPIMLEELQNSAGGRRVKSYRIKTVTPVPPGEYALAVGSALLYDFGIDSSK